MRQNQQSYSAKTFCAIAENVLKDRHARILEQAGYN